MKIVEIMATLKTDNWYPVEDSGSYRQYKHPQKKGRITIVGNLNYDLGQASVDSILLQAGLKGSKK